MAIISMTPDQEEALKRSMQKENASKKTEQKKADPVPEPVLEKAPEVDAVVAAPVNQEEASIETETAESASFKTYKKRK